MYRCNASTYLKRTTQMNDSVLGMDVLIVRAPHCIEVSSSWWTLQNTGVWLKWPFERIQKQPASIRIKPWRKTGLDDESCKHSQRIRWNTGFEKSCMKEEDRPGEKRRRLFDVTGAGSLDAHSSRLPYHLPSRHLRQLFPASSQSSWETYDIIEREYGRQEWWN